MVKNTLELECFRKYDFPRGVISTPPHGISQDGKCHGTGRVKMVATHIKFFYRYTILKNAFEKKLSQIKIK